MSNEYNATIIADGLSFGEAPRWHDGRLWFSDFYRYGVFSIRADGSDERLEVSLATQPSGLGWLPDGRLLIVSMTDHRVVRVSADGSIDLHADLAEHCGYWANDMVVADDGTAYVGNFGFDLDAFLAEHGIEGVLTPPGPPTTSLVVLSPSGEILQVVKEMAFPNGSVITPDGTTLIVAETMAMRLTSFEIASDGTLGNRQVFAQLELVPADGICLDAEGQVWVANALSPEAIRVAPGGEITGRVHTSQTCFACMLGGPDGRTLFAMTAPTSTARIARERTDAKIETAEVSVARAGRP